jgi:hypothetical protein
MDERRRESVIARLALVLVLLLVAVVLWPGFGERVTSWGTTLVDQVRAYWGLVVQRAAMDPPQREPPPQRPQTGMPQLPPYPPPLALDLAPAPTQTATPAPAAPAPPAGARPPSEVAAAPKPPLALSEPAPVAPTPEEKERAAANARMVLRSGDVAPTVDALLLDRLMDRGIAMFNATDKETERLEASRLIYVTAALGYGPSRALIARSYPRSQAVRQVTPVVDAVRFAFDAFAVGGTYSKNPEHVATSLAVYLIDQGQADMLASAVIDAMRDDARLQVIASLELMFDALNLARGACPAIGRLVKAPVGIAASECSPAVKSQALTYAKQAGPTGRDAALAPKIAAAFAEMRAKYR